MFVNPRSGSARYYILIAGDCLALFLFIFSGQRSHATAEMPGMRTVVQALTLALPWIVLALWQGGTNVEGSLSSFLKKSFEIWLAAGPLGVLLRAVVLKHDVIATNFMLVALVFGGLFLLGWRTLFWFGWKYRNDRNSAG